MNEELVDQLRRAESAPYGKARSALLEDVVRRADAAGEDDLGFYSRLSLVSSYVLGGEPRKSLVPFARCVADWDADPGRYQAHSHRFYWSFKFVPGTLAKFPEVPLDHAYAVLDDMERRWQAAGFSMHAVHHRRWIVARHIGDAEEAAEQFRLWSTSPRDDLSDCAGCDPTGKVEHLTGVGRTADAVGLAVKVLSGQLTCNSQPQDMLTTLLRAYVAEGMFTEAADAHRKAYRILRGRAGELHSHAEHIEFLARTGNEPKAIELIERHLSECEDPPSPFAEMTFAAAAAHALGRVGDLTIRLPKAEPVPAAELSERLAGRALELAAQFDERNGTTYRSEAIRTMLTAEPWVEYLPLSETARRARLLQQAPSAPVPEAVVPEAVAPEAAAAPVGRGWLDRAEDTWQRGAHDEATAAWQRFEQEVPEGEWTPVDRARVLDGRGLVAQDPEVAMAAWREALALYADAGEEVRVLRDRARIGRTLCAGGRVDEGLATAEEPVRWLIAHDEPRRRARWQYSLATMYAAAGRAEDSLRELTELRQRTHIDDDDLRPAGAIIECDMLAQLGRLEEAEAAATIGLGLPDDQQRSFTHRRRGWLRLRLERPAEAVEDLIEAVALAAGTPGLEEHVALTRVELARGYLMTGRPLDAAETGEEALPVLGGSPDLADHLADARGLLIQAYRALGEFESALTKVRELLAAAPTDAHPGWLAMVREDEGLLLQQLDRDEAAVDAFLAAASSYEAAEQPVDQVQAVRLAGQSAARAGDLDRAVELIERIRPVLDALPSADQYGLFQDAGLDWDLASIALRRGETDAAVRHATRAAELYERGGHDDMHTSARLLIAEHGSTDEKLVEEIFTALPTGHDLWHRAGWLLVDRLNAQGRSQEATALEVRLTG